MIMKLLERRKEKGNAEIEMKKKQTASEGTEISVEEVERQMRKLRKRKAPGRDGVQNEAWMYETEGNSGVPGEKE
jgi:predicted nucleotidyltransferase